MYLKNPSPAFSRSGSGLLTSCLLLGAAPWCDAAIIANYEFTGGVLTSSDLDLDTTASDFTGTPAPTTAVTNRLTYAAANAPTTWSTSTGFASFTLTPGSSPLSLASLSFDYGFNNIATGGNYTVRVFSSVTGFTDLSQSLYTFTNDDGSNSGNYAVTPTNRVITLSSLPAFQNISTPVEFRFYFTDGHTGATRYHLLDNVVLNAVPEPSHAMLCLAGAGAFMVRRRRR
ncbi:MAG: PEP-CTERM sorting domain-containing protein [Akkermansiaceae bacterium]|nr:PEP-CTERM sorting domain-containing protein [Akkermansiaceae bacterium]